MNAAEANILFAQINEAYKTLIDPQKRQAYDLALVKQHFNFFDDYSIGQNFESIYQLLLATTHKVASIASDDINQTELLNFLQYFYSNEVMIKMKEQDDKELNKKYFNILFDLTQSLKYAYILILNSKIEDNFYKEKENMLILNKIIINKKKEDIRIRLKPLWILLTAIFICAIIFFTK